VVIQGVKVIDQLLIVFHGYVRFCLFDVGDLCFITFELLFDFFNYTFVVFNLLLNVLICDSFCRVSRLLVLRGDGLLVFELLRQASLDKGQNRGYFRIVLSNFGECFHIYLVLLCGIDIT